PRRSSDLDHVDRASNLLLDEGASDGRVLLPGFSLIEALDLRVILNGSDGGMAERELQVPVSVLAASVPALARRVVGPRHHPAVREKLTGRREALDPIDLEVQRRRDELADARDHQQTLDVGVWNQVRLQLLLDAPDLTVQELDLFIEEAGLEDRLIGQVRRLGHV